LHAEADVAGFRVSLATVYNTLHQFTESGLLRAVAIDGSPTYFDTNASNHHHFFVEGEGQLIDLVGDIGIDRLPEPPEGMEVTAVELVVRVRRRRR
jgi:Fur family iron response transcriptional regulator